MSRLEVSMVAARCDMKLLGLPAYLALLLPCDSLANKLEAPGTVEARVDGSFSYQGMFTAGPDSVQISSAGWAGFLNVSGGLIEDCFCYPGVCVFEAGETKTLTVKGNLQDPKQHGSVITWVAICDEPDLSVTTIVLPFGTSPVEAKTWTDIKALYR